MATGPPPRKASAIANALARQDGVGKASEMCGVFPSLGDSRTSFSAAISEARPDPISPRNLILVSRWTQLINYEARTC